MVPASSGWTPSGGCGDLDTTILEASRVLPTAKAQGEPAVQRAEVGRAWWPSPGLMGVDHAWGPHPIPTPTPT